MKIKIDIVSSWSGKLSLGGAKAACPINPLTTCPSNNPHSALCLNWTRAQSAAEQSAAAACDDTWDSAPSHLLHCSLMPSSSFSVVTKHLLKFLRLLKPIQTFYNCILMPLTWNPGSPRPLSNWEPACLRWSPRPHPLTFKTIVWVKIIWKIFLTYSLQKYL